MTSTFSITDLQREISQEIERVQLSNGPILHPDWITQAVMSRHPRIEGHDADFHLCCSRSTIRKEVGQLLNKAQAPTAAEKQLSMDGFEHLQNYYLVKRDGDRLAVRIDLLTDTEIEHKVEEYMAMGNACMEHADELRRYKLRRPAQTADLAVGFEARTAS